jgi:hypothetical protein
MELTPKRLRRVSSDAPTGLKDEPSRFWRAERKRSQERLEGSFNDNPQKGSRSDLAKVATGLASSSASVPLSPHTPPPSRPASAVVSPTGNPAPPMPASNESVEQAVPYMATLAGCSEGIVMPGAPPSAGNGMERLLILQEAREDGVLEFELGGEVYRVKDTSAFNEVVATGARETKQPRRRLSDLRRAQQLARASAASAAADAKASAVAEAVLTGGPAAAQVTTSASSSKPCARAADVKLLQAWRLAKEEAFLEEPEDLEALD